MVDNFNFILFHLWNVTLKFIWWLKLLLHDFSICSILSKSAPNMIVVTSPAVQMSVLNLTWKHDPLWVGNHTPVTLSGCESTSVVAGIQLLFLALASPLINRYPILTGKTILLIVGILIQKFCASVWDHACSHWILGKLRRDRYAAGEWSVFPISIPYATPVPKLRTVRPLTPLKTSSLSSEFERKITALLQFGDLKSGVNQHHAIFQKNKK